MMQRTILVCLFLISSNLLNAQSSPLPKYKVLKGHPPQEALAAVNEAADQGYRVLLSARLLVMRLDATPPDTYRYQPRPESSKFNLNSFQNALNQQGALGYAWRQDSWFLEKQPHPRNYEYRLLLDYPGKIRKQFLESFQADGFSPVGSTGGGQVVYIHEIGSPKPAAPLRPTRVVDALRKDNLMKDISALAAQGYRYHSHELSRIGGGTAVSMEECDASCGGPFEYRSFDVKDAALLEQDLNALGQEGFRVVPQSLDWPPNLVERPVKHAGSFVYRVADAPDAATTQQFLDACDRDGFVAIGFAAHVGWNVHILIVTEKAMASAPQ
ncbi:MAG: hypothetical protein WCA89_08540 [Terracidiphilus sp.]|jgi:hypothetical protein